MKKRVTVYLTPEQYHTLRVAAAQQHVSMAAFLRRAALDSVDRQRESM